MYRHLTSEQRYYIEVSLHNKMSQKDIAKNIGVSESTISRELERNKNMRGVEREIAASRSLFILTAQANRIAVFPPRLVSRNWTL